MENNILNVFKKDQFKKGNYKKLSDIINVIDNRGKTPPLEKSKTNYPIVEVAQLSNNNNMIINIDTCEKYVNQETYNSFFRNGHLKKNDVLISTVGTIGVAAFNFVNGLSIAQNVVALRTDYSYYLYCYLINERETILNLDIGGVQPSVKIPHLLNLNIFIPNELDLNIYKSIFETIYSIHKKNINLQKIKQKYLNKFFG